MENRGEKIVSVLGALVLGVGLFAPVAVAAQGQQGGQDDVPELTTDELRGVPGAIVGYRTADSAKPKTDVAAATGRPLAPGFTRVVTKSGYSFDRPSAWKQVGDLTPKGAPSDFTLDAVFEDAKTGAAATAISRDLSKVKTPPNIGDRATVDSLLDTMLKGGDQKATVKIISRTTGEIPEKSTSWVRVQAEGRGKTQGGGTVATTFWVQMVQTPRRLALVAVGYPSSQQGASAAAQHTVETLEVADGTGGGKSEPGKSDTRAGNATSRSKKDGPGGVRSPK